MSMIIITVVRFPLPVVDMSEVNKNKAGSEIFPTVSAEAITPALSRPEEKYVYRWEAILSCLFTAFSSSLHLYSYCELYDH